MNTNDAGDCKALGRTLDCVKKKCRGKEQPTLTAFTDEELIWLRHAVKTAYMPDNPAHEDPVDIINRANILAKLPEPTT